MKRAGNRCVSGQWEELELWSAIKAVLVVGCGHTVDACWVSATRFRRRAGSQTVTGCGMACPES